MKKYLTIAIYIFHAGIIGAQELEMDSATQKLIFRAIVKVDSATAGQLFEKGRQWVARAYNSANSVVQYENKDEGKIIIKGNWTTYQAIGYFMEHTLILEFKNGRARYTFTDFVKSYTDKSGLGGSKQTLESIKMMKKIERENFAKESSSTAESLVKYLKSLSSEKDDGW